MDATVETALLAGAFALFAGGQVTLWWRAGRTDPQATSLAVLTQGSALLVLTLYFRSAGLHVFATALGVLAAASLAGLVSAAVATSRHARTHGTSWWAAHRMGLRRTLVAVEALAAVVALVLVVSWSYDTAGRDFRSNANETLCRLLDGAC